MDDQETRQAEDMIDFDTEEMIVVKKEESEQGQGTGKPEDVIDIDTKEEKEKEDWFYVSKIFFVS